MSNITKIAPYTYLAKRSSTGTVYDLFLLVPVDSTKDVNLSNVQPVKNSGTGHITISYTSVPGSAATPRYRAKRWMIDLDAPYVDIIIQGDNSADLTTVVLFADADSQAAASQNDEHTYAPYLFVKKETLGGHNFFRPSTYVLFEGTAGAQNENVGSNNFGCVHTITPSGSGTLLDPENFAINQDVRHEISGSIYTFDGHVEASVSLGKPPRKHKVKVIWAPFFAMPTGVTSPAALEEVLEA